MTENPDGRWHRIKRHLRNRFVSGLLVMVPFIITFTVIRFLYRSISATVSPVVDAVLPPQFPPALIPILSAGLLLIVLYLAGSMAAHLIGRKAMAVGEAIMLRIPFIRSVYGASRKAIDSLQTSSRTAFKSVVLIEFPRAGFQSNGFVTGTIMSEAGGRRLMNVFIPTTPNPTSGFLQFVPEDAVTPTAISVEDGIKLIVSGGILSPSALIRKQPDLAAEKASE